MTPAPPTTLFLIATLEASAARHVELAETFKHAGKRHLAHKELGIAVGLKEAISSLRLIRTLLPTTYENGIINS